MPLTMATIRSTEATSAGVVTALFNPTELTMSSKALMKGEDGQYSFNRYTQDAFTVKLFFDTYETGNNVHSKFSKLEDWQKPTKSIGFRRVPPSVDFSYGSVQYSGVITSLSVNYTMFTTVGTPVRADVSVTMQVIYGNRQQIVNSGRDNCRRLVTVRQNDRLDLIASDQTGSASNWRAIAAANDVEDPLDFPEPTQIGRTFVIPDFVGTNQ